MKKLGVPVLASVAAILARDTYALQDYYLEKIKRALAEYNANPVNNPPMKDENGEEVVFP